MFDKSNIQHLAEIRTRFSNVHQEQCFLLSFQTKWVYWGVCFMDIFRGMYAVIRNNTLYSISQGYNVLPVTQMISGCSGRAVRWQQAFRPWHYRKDPTKMSGYDLVCVDTAIRAIWVSLFFAQNQFCIFTYRGTSLWIKTMSIVSIRIRTTSQLYQKQWLAVSKITLYKYLAITNTRLSGL